MLIRRGVGGASVVLDWQLSLLRNATYRKNMLAYLPAAIISPGEQYLTSSVVSALNIFKAEGGVVVESNMSKTFGSWNIAAARPKLEEVLWNRLLTTLDIDAPPVQVVATNLSETSPANASKRWHVVSHASADGNNEVVFTVNNFTDCEGTTKGAARPPPKFIPVDGLELRLQVDQRGFPSSAVDVFTGTVLNITNKANGKIAAIKLPRLKILSSVVITFDDDRQLDSR